MAYGNYPISTDSLATSAPQIQANFSYLSTILNPTVTAEEHVVCFVGEIRMFGGTTVPKGWLACDGTAYSRTNASYAGLFSVIGTSYGVGDGANTFNVPSFCNVFVRGVATSPGSTGGADTHTHNFTVTSTVMPEHNHALTAYRMALTSASAGFADNEGGGYTTQSGGNTSNAGSGGTGATSDGTTVPKYGTAMYVIKR